jgi:hypothetical protein
MKALFSGHKELKRLTRAGTQQGPVRHDGHLLWWEPNSLRTKRLHAGLVDGDTSEWPGLQGPDNRSELRDYGTKSHTRLVAEEWCPAVGKTRRAQPDITNLVGGPEGATTPLARLHKPSLPPGETRVLLM